jgi:4-hydroxythreonine-4-phosphate dehydrogenase
MRRPTIAITMGDAAGVGPEIAFKALLHKELYEFCRPVVIGDARRLREVGRIVGSSVRVVAVDDPSLASFAYGVIECVDVGMIPVGFPWGRVSPVCGDAAYRYLVRAVELAVNESVDAICTAPISKEALVAADHRFPGNTDILAYLTKTTEVSMMLATQKLRVIHVTTHMGLIDAIMAIEPGLVGRTIARGRHALIRAGIAEPRIGVCGINPHAGENGIFGRGEERVKIEPAVRACAACGWAVQGPLPADTLFLRAGRGDFDLVVAMYHDQGHIPIKVTGIDEGVNITVGLPFVRTSVDHGTAFDIAGTGKADERSLLAALRQAANLL